jgi:hypothetical protein
VLIDCFQVRKKLDSTRSSLQRHRNPASSQLDDPADARVPDRCSGDSLHLCNCIVGVVGNGTRKAETEARDAEFGGVAAGFAWCET